jgi:hypothetical protein
MGRFPMVVSAAVASAMIVVAVAALDAVGADKTNAQGKTDDRLVAAFAACVRDRGVEVPALTGVALERWVKTHRLPMATARACKTALAGQPPVSSDAAKADAAKIAACLRSHGLHPPTDAVELKLWISEQRSPEVEAALKDCGMGPAPRCGDKDDKPAGGGTRPDARAVPDA